MKKVRKNKGWVYLLILVLLIGGGLFLKYYKKPAPEVVENKEGEVAELKESKTLVSISTKNLKEENFTGTVPVITGSSLLANAAQKYIDKRISEFRIEANTDVPPMRQKFGDKGTPEYTIEMNATEVTSVRTKSVVMSEYVYTGGANGNSAYKVITASEENGEILSLSQIIKKDKQAAFTSLVKKELLAWKPEGTDASPVFPDEVKNLMFGTFTNWSLDSKNLILYFDKYQIGPGVLGPVAFPISLSKIKSFLNLTY